MGWTGITMGYGKPTRKEIRDYLDKEFGSWKNEKCAAHLMKSAMGSSVWYGVIQYDFIEEKSTKREAMVVLTSTSTRHGIGELYYKEMHESMGPNEARCPETLLRLLTPTDNEYAISWRKKCQLNNINEKIYNAKNPCTWVIKHDHNFVVGNLSGELKTNMNFTLAYNKNIKRYQISSAPKDLGWLYGVNVPKAFLLENGNLEVRG